jgi:hypothetical protein
MNTITPEQQTRILELLAAGKSAREIERITGHRRETILLYGRLAGLLPRDRNSGARALAHAA